MPTLPLVFVRVCDPSRPSTAGRRQPPNRHTPSWPPCPQRSGCRVHRAEKLPPPFTWRCRKIPKFPDTCPMDTVPDVRLEGQLLQHPPEYRRPDTIEISLGCLFGLDVSRCCSRSVPIPQFLPLSPPFNIQTSHGPRRPDADVAACVRKLYSSRRVSTGRSRRRPPNRHTPSWRPCPRRSGCRRRPAEGT